MIFNDFFLLLFKKFQIHYCSLWRNCKVKYRYVITIHINRKPYMMSQMTPSYLTFSDIERLKSRTLRFRSLISCKGAEVGHVLLLKYKQESIYGESIDAITLDLSDLETLMPRLLAFQRLISRKGTDLGHVLLLNINRKPYMGSPTTRSHLTLSDLERLKSRSLRFRSIISRKGAVRPQVTN